MSHTQVPQIELMDDGGIVLTVEVFGFEVGTQVEISGSATQANGAIATFYDIQNLPPARPGGGSLVTIKAAPTSGFVADEVVTVVGRAAKIWGSVLYGDPDNVPADVKAVWATNPEILLRSATWAAGIRR